MMAPKSAGTTTVVVTAMAIAAGVGCVPLSDEVPDRGDLFAPLHNADLAGVEYELALDAHAGRDDSWTAVGHALIALANCTKISAPPKVVQGDPEARLVYELIRLEDERRLRLIRVFQETGDGPWHAGTIHTKFTSRTFFERSQPDIDDELIHWGATGEAWPDEWPAPASVDYECETLDLRERPDTLPPPFDAIDPGEPTGHLITEWLQTQRVLLALDTIDPGSALYEQVASTVIAHRADLALALYDRDDAQEVAPETVSEVTSRVLGELREAGPEPDPQGPVGDLGRFLRIAWVAMTIGEIEIALPALRELTRHRNENVARTARYYGVKLAWSEGWWDVAADLSPHMIDGPQSMRSAFAYFAATAHRHDGRKDSFLGLSREALRDRQRYPDDPFLGALFREVLRELAHYDIDERTEELLEEFGPRGRLAMRKRIFAEVALDLGRPTIAEKMVTPLIDDNRDARELPRLRAVLALAAFMRDDRDEFDRQIHFLLERPEQLRDAIPRRRRGAFFANQDSELARVLRAMLPLMAEWGDDEASRALRQTWLESITTHTQTFLRQAPESAVSENLTELYKLASQLLDDHPRGYASRVGAQKPSASALVLGTVDMPPSPPVDEAPRPRLRWPAIGSLLLIPKQGVPPAQFTTDLEPYDVREESP